jgi:hypothetical protein
MLHDAHEAVTSDIPQPWKTDDMRELQRQLDVRLYGSLNISQPDLITQRTIHQIDNQLVYHEAVQVAPQIAPFIVRPGDNFRDSINRIDPIAEEAISKCIDWNTYMSPEYWGENYQYQVEEMLHDN